MALNITKLPLESVINTNTSHDSTFESFYEVFGTSGCLLDCDARKEYQEFSARALPQQEKLNSIRFRKRKENKRSYAGSNQNFNLGELLASIQQGCGSCKVLKAVFEIVSLINPEDYHHEDSVSLSVSRAFMLKRHGAEEKHIALFSPLGTPAKFLYMHPTSFLSGNTNSDVSLARASEWLNTCVRTHNSCQQNVTSHLPSRLIDVTRIMKDDHTEGVKLVQTRQGQVGKYACLSHCWGRIPIKCCTTTERFEQALEFIDWDTLPRNFQDAISLTRRLQIPYIWIDSMCIIQQDTQDWEIESAKMADVYKGSYITIAAAGSADSTGGCFIETNPDICIRITEENDRSFLVGARMCDTLGFLEDPESVRKRHPLLQRAWVYQERMLSPRVLYCNYGEFAFTCLAGRLCECGNNGIPPHTSLADVPIGKIKANLLMAKALDSKRTNIHDFWTHIVAKYMKLNLTKTSDILPAISGCARVVAELTGDEYFAGAWKKHFAQYMLWYTKSRRRAKSPRTEWTAPTWSWASMPPGHEIFFFGEVDLSPLKQLLKGSIDELRCVPQGKNDLGELVRGTGSLVLKAELLPCHIRWKCRARRKLKEGASVRFRRFTYNLYYSLEASSAMKDCPLPVPELDSYEGNFTLHADVPIKDLLEWTVYPQCTECMLAPVRLLRVGIIEERDRREDYFMLLRETCRTNKAYERLGLAVFERQHATVRNKWFKEVWERHVLPENDITIN